MDSGLAAILGVGISGVVSYVLQRRLFENQFEVLNRQRAAQLHDFEVQETNARTERARVEKREYAIAFQDQLELTNRLWIKAAGRRTAAVEEDLAEEDPLSDEDWSDLVGVDLRLRALQARLHDEVIDELLSESRRLWGEIVDYKQVAVFWEVRKAVMRCVGKADERIAEILHST